MTPAHLVPAVAYEHHGVARLARRLAAAVGAEVVETAPSDARRVHLHVTDRLFGATPEAAADEITRLCVAHPTTLTLHDLPQPSDGATFGRRAAAYARMVEHALGCVVSSRHEQALLRTHTPACPADLAMIPLPVVEPTPPPALPTTDPPVIAVAGWIYPGKGHLEVLRAAAAQDRPVDVVALGAVTPGHDDVADTLAKVAADLGVGWRLTGPLDERDMSAALRSVSVGVTAHRNLSASGSINAWIAAGRRPLVPRSSYTREMAAMRPDTLTVYDDGHLASALAHGLRDPGSTVLGPRAVTRPHLDDVAAAYRAWWARWP